MTRELDSQVIQAKNQLELQDNWYYYLEIEYDDGQYLRFTNRPPVNPGETSVAFDGKDWDCIAMEIGDLEMSREGLQPSISIRIGNANRVVGTYVDQYNMAGRTATLYRVLDSLRNQPDTALSETYLINTIDVSAQEVAIQLGGINVLELEIPTRTFTRSEFPGIPYGYRRGIIL